MPDLSRTVHEAAPLPQGDGDYRRRQSPEPAASDEARATTLPPETPRYLPAANRDDAKRRVVRAVEALLSAVALVPTDDSAWHFDGEASLASRAVLAAEARLLLHDAVSLGLSAAGAREYAATLDRLSPPERPTTPPLG